VLARLVFAMALLIGAATATAGTGFVYQGELTAAGQSVTSADLSFELYAAATGGSPLTVPVVLDDVAVEEGRFAVSVDFGDVFAGEDRWLQISVRVPHDPGDTLPYTTLTPRRAVSPAPLAQHTAGAEDAETASNTLDMAYDEGGPGAGRIITADAGPVRIAGADGLYVTPGLGIGTQLTDVPLDVAAGSDVTLSGGSYAMIGWSFQTNLALDDNEIMARDGGAVSALFFNHNGGDVLISDVGSGRLGVGTDAPLMTLHVDGGVHLAGSSEDLSWPPGQGLEAGTWDGSVFDDHLWLYRSSGAPVLHIPGTGALPNVQLRSTADDPDHGAVRVCNHNGSALASMSVLADGTGYVVANVKNFRVANPRDPSTEIWYAAVEGPEAAAYVRGTARLVGGRAVIDLPEHFQDVAGAAGMTVQLTPRSAASLGLAAVERTPARVVVRELRRGTGSYRFDWLVKAIRRGHEDYRVIRPQPAGDAVPHFYRPAEPADAARRAQRAAQQREGRS
jgi:hypothetical protein